MLAIGLLATPPAVVAEAPSLDELLQRFAAMPGMSARFREERRLTVLQAPIWSEGALYFAPPDRLARHVEGPSPSLLIVRGDRITFQAGTGLHGLNLATLPSLRAFVDGLRLLLRGDATALREVFAVEFETEPGRGAWSLQLSPRDEAVREAVAAVRVTGRAGTLETIQIVEGRGDETTLHLSQVDMERRFDSAEIERLFRAPES